MRRIAVLSVAAALLASGCALTQAAGTNGSLTLAATPVPTQSPVQSPSPTAPLTIAPGETPVEAVVRQVRPAVVNVTTNLLQNTGLGLQPGRGVGTGIVIRSDGVIVTNYHVVEGAGYSVVGGERLDWEDKDVFTVPTWIFHEHVNSGDRPAFLFSFSDAPVMKALSLYREETRA